MNIVTVLNKIFRLRIFHFVIPIEAEHGSVFFPHSYLFVLVKFVCAPALACARYSFSECAPMQGLLSFIIASARSQYIIQDHIMDRSLNPPGWPYPASASGSGNEDDEDFYFESSGKTDPDYVGNKLLVIFFT